MMDFIMNRSRFFLVLVGVLFLFSCKEKVPEKETEVAPTNAKLLLSQDAIPDYEKSIDHAGLIKEDSRGDTAKAGIFIE